MNLAYSWSGKEWLQVIATFAATVTVMGTMLFVLPDFLRKPYVPPEPFVPAQASSSGQNSQIQLYDSVDKNMADGIRLANSHEYKGAISLLNQTIAKYPASSDALCWRGFCYMKLNENTKALSDFNLAAKTGNKAWAYYERGRLFQQESQFSKAINDLNKAIELFPTYSRAYSERGYAKFIGMRQFDSAIQDLNRAIELDPSNFEAYIDRGFVYLSCGAYDLAIADTNRSIRINPNSPLAYKIRGTAKQKLGFYRSAISDYEKCLQYVFKHKAFEHALHLYNDIGDCYLEMAEFDSAFLNYSKLVDEDWTYIWKIPCDLVSDRVCQLYKNAKHNFHRVKMPTTTIRIEGISQKTPAREFRHCLSCSRN